MLFKLVDSGLLEEVNGCVSTGKEACVYHARGGSADGRVLPTEVAIKVFKTTLNEFKTRDKYIKDDYRFKQRFRKQNPRKVIQMWAEKEYHNLRRLGVGQWGSGLRSGAEGVGQWAEGVGQWAEEWG